MKLRLSLLAAVVTTTAFIHAEPPAAASAAAFLRTADLPENARGLQTASAEYRPAGGAGPSVWLIGVAHLGTADYFKAIQQRLHRQTILLYKSSGSPDPKKRPGGGTGR